MCVYVPRELLGKECDNYKQERSIRQLSEQKAWNVFDRAFSELLQDWYNDSSGVAQNFKQENEKRNLSLM